jgi:hypothetical protein
VEQLTLTKVKKLLDRLITITKGSDKGDNNEMTDVVMTPQRIKELQQEYLDSLTPEQLAELKAKHGIR